MPSCYLTQSCFQTVLKAAWGGAALARYPNPCDYGSADQEKSSAAQAAVTGTQYGGPCARLPMHFSQYYTIKLLPWQLDLQPHKRNTSNSFLRMPQIAHAQGISLKNTFLMQFLMSDRFRILNQRWWTGKWDEPSTYTGELHPDNWFVACVMCTCVDAYLHMCGLHLCAGRYMHVQGGGPRFSLYQDPLSMLPKCGVTGNYYHTPWAFMWVLGSSTEPSSLPPLIVLNGLKFYCNDVNKYKSMQVG